MQGFLLYWIRDKAMLVRRADAHIRPKSYQHALSLLTLIQEGENDMKKLLSILLAAALLLSFGAIGASAATPEDQAWALLLQAKTTLDSGTYTVSHGNLYVFTKQGDRIATEARHGYPGCVPYYFDVFRELTGNRFLGEFHRLISTPEGNFLVFPKLKIYAQIDPDIPVSRDRIDNLENLCPSKEPDSKSAESYGHADGSVFTEAVFRWEERNGSGTWLKLTCAVSNGEFFGIISEELQAGNPDPVMQHYMLDTINPEVNESLFSTEGMTELPWWLMKPLASWVWVGYSHNMGDGSLI